MKTRTPDSPKPSTAKSLKSAWKKSKKSMSLKTFGRSATASDIQQAYETWKYNKAANFSSLPKGIGNTHKVKTRQAKPKDDAK